MSAPTLIRAPFFHTPANPFVTSGGLVAEEDGGLLISDGRIAASGAFDRVKRSADTVETLDWRGGYVLPGFIDTHVHFPQLRIIGGLGRTLLDWLQHVALPEEARMADAAYARETARLFVHALLSHGTTTALVFGAHYAEATTALFEAASQKGLRMASGLVISDRALRADLHQTPDAAYADCKRLIDRFHGRDQLLYAVTPRFALSTSEAMLEVCRTLVQEHPDVHVQTHINEQPDEVAACLQAFPWAGDYLAIYERYGLTRRGTVLAHNVHATGAELARLASSRTSIAHCPCSNAALGSGIFPLARHLAAGVHVALGTDVGGGTGFSLAKEALQAYMMQRVTPHGVALDAARLLYLATRAGAEALVLEDRTGDLTAGKSADLIYVRPAVDSPLAAGLLRAESMEQALAAIITLAGVESIQEVRVAGRIVTAFQPQAR
jgi:guanine deaminase